MRKQLTIITLGILMMNLALAMYAGSNMTFETELINPVYTVVGNNSNLEGLNVTFENGNITISPVLNYEPDNFTLVFFDEVTREVEKIVYRGGGGSSRTKIKYVDNNVTIYVPEYINTTETIEVEKIVDNTTVIQAGYELWMVLLAIAIGGAFIFFIMYQKKKKTAEEIVEEIKDGEYNNNN